MKSLLCVLCMIAVALVCFVAPSQSQACDNFSQQVQFSTAFVYAEPVLVEQINVQPVYEQQLVQRQVQQVRQVRQVQAVAYQPQFVTANVRSVQRVEFLEVGCSRGACSRAAVRGPRVQRSVQRTRIRG